MLLSKMTFGHCPNTYTVLLESGENGGEWKHQKKKTHVYCSPTTCKVRSGPHPNTSVIIPAVEMRRLTLSKVKYLTQGHWGRFPDASPAGSGFCENPPLPISVLMRPGLGTWLRHRRLTCFISWTPGSVEG